LRSFVFKKCFKCKSPYSAGKAECAAGMGGGGGGGAAAGADGVDGADGGVLDEMPAERPEDAICSGCRDSDAGIRQCAKHGKDYVLWKCRYCCDRLSSYECFDYLHVCEPCHSYQKLDTLLNFNQKVGEDDPLRGGVPGAEMIYANKKQLWEYDQCPGPDQCKLGCAHPPHGLEFCFGCSKCFEEAGYAREKLPDALLLLQRLDARYGYMAGLATMTDDADKLKEVDRRLIHCLWWFGGAMLADGTASKRDIIAALARVGEPAFLKSCRLGGQSKALAKSKKVHEVAAALDAWMVEMKQKPDAVQKIEQDTKVAVGYTIADVEQYSLPGRKARKAAVTVTAVRQNVTFKLNLMFAKKVDGLGDDDGVQGAPPSPGEKLSAVMGKTAKKLTAAREAKAKAKADAEAEAAAAAGADDADDNGGDVGSALVNIALDTPVAALAVALGARGGSCTGFVDKNGLPCGIMPLSQLLRLNSNDSMAETVQVHAFVASEEVAQDARGRRRDEFAVWWSLM